jgi:hypothetical protein
MPKGRGGPRFASRQPVPGGVEPSPGVAVRPDLPDADIGQPSPLPAPQFEPDAGWVPADQRLLGLDRRTIGPTVAVFALAMLMSVVLELINANVAYNDVVRAGDLVELDGGVTFVPEAGWGITSGVRAGNAPMSGSYPQNATVENGEVNFTVQTAPFHGDAGKLLDQIEATSDALNRGRGAHVTTEPTTITTEQGRQGTIAQVAGPQTGGVIATFVFDGHGVEAEATGPSDIDPDTTAAILRMIRSIGYRGEGQR